MGGLPPIFVRGEALQEQEWANRVFSHPLSFNFSPGPDQTMNIEPHLPPAENAFCPFRIEELFGDRV